MIVSDSLADLQRKFDAWKSGMEDKGLRVNVDKTKLMVSGPNLNPIHDSGKYPCGVCGQGVSRNSIFCKGCISTGFSEDVQANRGELGKTLHFDARDV